MTTIRDITQPPGGWRYKVPETGLEITAATAATLRGRILSHLAANGIEGPHDINAAICNQMGLGEPYCQEKQYSESVPSEYPALTVDTANRFMKTALGIIKERRLVDKDEAQRRMDVCMACPKSTSLGLCVFCNGLALTLLRLIRGNTPKALENREWCAACGCRLDAKVLIPNDILDKAEKVRPEYHPSCWRHSSSPNA